MKSGNEDRQQPEQYLRILFYFNLFKPDYVWGGGGGGGRGKGLTEGSEIKSRLPGLALICSVCSSYLLPPRRIETVSVKYCEMMSNRLGITSRWTING